MSHDPALLDRALALAEAALGRGEWPVAALLALDGTVVAEAEAFALAARYGWRENAV